MHAAALGPLAAVWENVTSQPPPRPPLRRRGLHSKFNICGALRAEKQFSPQITVADFAAVVVFYLCLVIFFLLFAPSAFAFATLSPADLARKWADKPSKAKLKQH